MKINHFEANYKAIREEIEILKEFAETGEVTPEERAARERELLDEALDLVDSANETLKAIETSIVEAADILKKASVVEGALRSLRGVEEKLKQLLRRC